MQFRIVAEFSPNTSSENSLEIFGDSNISLIFGLIYLKKLQVLQKIRGISVNNCSVEGNSAGKNGRFGCDKSLATIISVTVGSVYLYKSAICDLGKSRNARRMR